VRALAELRAEKAGQIKRQGTAAMAFDGGSTSGKKVVEATCLTKSYDGKQIVRGFDLTVQRGDRIAFVGPNGVGKTTVLNMLLGKVEPDEGSIKLGTNLDIAVFDQTRAALDPNMTLWENLASDPVLGVSGKSDQIMVRGAPKHVVGYLKEFLFDEAQARAPVRSLSGGEKARLLLARLMARESNVLVLDEPTNDLDIETLDLLQDILGDYDGTVMLVSHDRDFLDRVATTTIAMEGNGQVVAYAGGWTDYRSQRRADTPEAPKSVGKQLSKGGKQAAPVARKTALSFTEKHRLEELPDVMEKLTDEIAKLEILLSDPDLFTSQPAKFQKASDALVARQTALQDAEEEWLTLEEKADS
jgi:ATP-binding cassette subfamily F protein uup